MLPSVNWDYAAGFIDGEGTLTFTRYGQSEFPLLIIYQKDTEVLRQLADFFAVPVRYRSINGQVHNRLEISGAKRLLPILTELQHRLIVKREHCRLMLEFINCRLARGKYRATYDDHCRLLVRDLAALQMKGRKRTFT